MKKLIKNLNSYAFDNINDDNFTTDFSQLSVEDKYGIEKNHLRECHKRLHLSEEARLSLAMNSEFVKSAEGNSKKDTPKTFQGYNDEHIEKMLSTFEEFESICERMENLIEEGYDDEYNLHDRSVDYDYDYENDCEYDGDEEIFGYDN